MALQRREEKTNAAHRKENSNRNEWRKEWLVEGEKKKALGE